MYFIDVFLYYVWYGCWLLLSVVCWNLRTRVRDARLKRRRVRGASTIVISVMIDCNYYFLFVRVLKIYVCFWYCFWYVFVFV